MTALALAGLAALLVMVGAMALVWAIVERTRRSGFVDGTWSLATGVTTILLIGTVAGIRLHALVIMGLVGLWALRLGGHLLLRSTRDAGDDPRYARLRRDWGAAAPWRMFLFLQSQAIAGWLLAIAATAAATRHGGLGLLTGLGALISVLALVGEGHADRTLAAFRQRGGRGICEDGPWGWSRHPNYLFEWLFWLGIALAGLDLTGPGWRDGLAFLAPIEIYWLLVHVSGIPPLEAHMLETRGEAFRAYQRRVPAFFPSWPGRRG